MSLPPVTFQISLLLIPLRSSNFCFLSFPCSICKTKCDRTFAVLAPTLWNSLPHSLRLTESVDSFKQLIKTHLYRQPFCRFPCLFFHLLCLFYLSLPFCFIFPCLSFLLSLVVFLCAVMFIYLLFGKHF